MSATLTEIIKHLFDSLDEKRKLQSLDDRTQRMLDRAIERVIDGTDQRIRAVTGYKRKLSRSILKALDYADKLIERVPSPIDLDSDHFVFDPYLRIFFPTKHGMMQVFQQSSELKEYFTDIEHANEAESYALLCMREYEETVLGMELQGDHVIKDVKQIRVNFAGHRIYAPAQSESAARRELKCCIFEGLVDNALARISELRKRRQTLEAERKILHSRLRSHKPVRQFAEDPQSPISVENNHRVQALQLEKLEQELDELGYVTPETCLDLVNEILSQPEHFVDLHNVSMRLDTSGIRREKQEPSDKVCDLRLSEVTIKGHPRRVVTLARINRKEITASMTTGA
jgi:hypothetical protein